MKRALTSSEIQSILDEITPFRCVQQEIAQQICNKAKNEIRPSLETIQVYPEVIPVLKDSIVKQYYKTQMEAGTCVGILTAQSLGERQTQLCLDAFHSTGLTISTVQTGVPRFVELLNATKNPKNVLTTIYTKEPFTTISDLRKAVGSSIVRLTLKDLMTSQTTSTTKKKWHSLFEMIYGTSYREGMYLSYTLDKAVLFKFDISLSTIKTLLEDAIDDICCVYSLDTLDIFVDTSAVPANDVPTFLQDVVHPLIIGVSLFGVEGLTEMMFQKTSDGLWYIQVLGQNLPEIGRLAIADFYKCHSNSMWEIYNVLGIEATREFLIAEFLSVISTDSFINKQHVELLVDTMLYYGTIASISRYGVQRNQAGPLTKSSFERSLDHILQAGLYGDTETTTGISSSIICGKPSVYGTGLCQLVYKQ